MVVLSIIIGILILGIMVIIHELGHFTAAKLLRFRVLAFSVGFGKVLLKKTIGETEYRISAIPFGGYVKMAGEQPDDEHTGEAHEFTVKPKWQRAVVAIAGPLANYLSAILMLWVMYMYGVEHPKYLDRPVIGFIADSSAAQAAGLAAGDSIVAVDGSSLSSWDELDDRFMSAGRELKVSVMRNSEMQNHVILRNPQNGPLFSAPFGMLPAVPAVVGRVNDTLPAGKAGLKSGDTLLKIDSIKLCSWFQISDILKQGKPGVPRQVELNRNGALATYSVIPHFDSSSKRSILGIEMKQPEMRMIRYSPVPAFGRCLNRTWSFTTMIFDVFGKLISRQVSTTELSGPVGIIPASGAIALQGLSPILNFMALISINLGVLNLFPLVITDGGLLLFLLIEVIRRKPLAIDTQIRINQIAIAFFIAFFFYVSLNDIHRLPEIFRIFGH